MSVSCSQCGAVAGYGHELGHRTGCPAIQKIPFNYQNIKHTKNHAEVCPVCNGSGQKMRYIHKSDLTCDIPGNYVPDGICNGCQGFGWITVSD